MQARELITYQPLEYESSGLETTTNPNIMAEGSRNVMITGAGKPSAFKGATAQAGKVGSRFMTQAGDSYAGLGSFANSNVKGSVARVMAGLFFAGSGALYYDGVSQGANASSILQLKLLTSGSFGATYQAGLSQPSAPTIATRTTLGVGKTGKLKAGTYSVKIYKIRSATGARSIASPASNIVIATESNNIGQSIRVTFPAADTNGGDRWGICVTPRNFGSTGLYFLFVEVAESALTTIDSVPRSFEIEWTDGDLVGQPLAPIESYPPPSCVFVGSLGNSVFVDGCYGDTVTGVSAASPGTVIASSLPLHPEEFPLDWLSFPPDAPTALLRGGDGFYYRFGKNSLGVVSYTGGEPAISYQQYWGTTGISYAHNAVVAEGGRLYAKTGTKGLVRIGNRGEPETLWSAKFIEDLEYLDDADTVLGWDENNQTVCTFNGVMCWTFNSTLEKVGSPIDMTGMVSGKVLSAVTHLGALYISCLDAANSAIKLYEFNSGTGSFVEIYTDWYFPEESAYIRFVDVKMRSDSTNTITLKVFKDEDNSTPILSQTFTPKIGSPVRLRPFKGLLPDLESFCVYLSQASTGGDAGFEKIKVSGYTKNIVK
jgi:hypothetical protein